jgi:hypothetical protein
MKWVLTCENGKEIDMTYYIGKQMENKITRQDVLDRIKFYKSTNKLWENLNTKKYGHSVTSM